jgi:hypothetical protein
LKINKLTGGTSFLSYVWQGSLQAASCRVTHCVLVSAHLESLSGVRKASFIPETPQVFFLVESGCSFDARVSIRDIHHFEALFPRKFSQLVLLKRLHFVN